jgi:hypothetical protein
VQVCVDDATRLAYVEVVADHQHTTAAAALRRRSFYARCGISVRRGSARLGRRFVQPVIGHERHNLRDKLAVASGLLAPR